MIIFCILLQFLMFVTTETMYSSIKSEYYQVSRTFLGDNKLNLSWTLVIKYKGEFDSTYGRKEFLPNRAILYTLSNPVLDLFNPLVLVYLKWFHGYEKLVVLQKKGGCEEFAIAVKTLLHDVLGVKTRIVCMEGFDHAFLEIWWNNSWWVVDKIFTTQNKPVKAKLYAKYLKENNKSVYWYIYNLKDYQTGHSVLAEHGFESVNITIVAIIDPTSNKSDDLPAKSAEIEVFALKNWYDPLIDKGETNSEGKYQLVLRKYGKLILLAKSSDGNFVGVSEINGSRMNDGDEVIVYLHKYG